jgi:hypothetical protein
MTKCTVCRRTLRNPTSIAHGAGPTCHRREKKQLKLELLQEDATKQARKESKEERDQKLGAAFYMIGQGIQAVDADALIESIGEITAEIETYRAIPLNNAEDFFKRRNDLIAKKHRMLAIANMVHVSIQTEPDILK